MNFVGNVRAHIGRELRGFKIGRRTVILSEDLSEWIKSRDPYAGKEEATI